MGATACLSRGNASQRFPSFHASFRRPVPWMCHRRRPVPMAESRDVPLLPAAPSRGRSTVRLSPRRAPGRGERRRTAEGEAILREGFRDAEGSYMLANTVLRGVFVSDVPLDINGGAAGGELLELTLSAELALDDFELVEDGKPYREWC